MDLNPAGQTPVLVERDKGTVLIDSGAICEYFEETIDRTPADPRHRRQPRRDPPPRHLVRREALSRRRRRR